VAVASTAGAWPGCLNPPHVSPPTTCWPSGPLRSGGSSTRPSGPWTAGIAQLAPAQRAPAKSGDAMEEIRRWKAAGMPDD